MPQPKINAEKDMKNLYVVMSKEDVERMKKGALLFTSATNYRPEIGQVNYRGCDWGKITESRREIDSSKVNATARVFEDFLNEYKNNKVVFFCTFKRDMYRMKEILSKYNPLVMNGDVTDSQARTSMMERFNRPDNKYRVFISNPRVGGLGVELDDTYGDFPRLMLILPNYNFIEQFQGTGRIYRLNTKSKATIRFIYSKAYPYECSILNSMIEKSKVARDLTLSNQKDIIFPGELKEEVEDEIDEL